jgi:hypothetical protein
MPAPSVNHEQRRALLESLAILAGFTECLSSLPDGSRPDILRVNSRCGCVFIGDAKDSETGTSDDTCRRLSRYMRWVFRLRRGSGGSVMALCFGHPDHLYRWASLLKTLTFGSRNEFSVHFCELGTDTVLWIVSSRERK